MRSLKVAQFKVSRRNKGVKDITLSLPHLVGGDGVLAAFHPTLNEVEAESLKSSASLIQKTIFELESSG